MQYLLPSFLEKDPVAKEHMHYAATIAGIAFSNSGNGICHTIADKMGATFKLTHGRANAIALPFVIKFNGIAAGKDFLHMARAIGFDGQDSDQAVNYLIQRVNTLKRQLHVQGSYKDAGISEDIFAAKLPDLVKRASVFPVTALNPRKPSSEEMEALFKACYRGDYSLI
jgi:alcohol dehydrogenase class IV